MSQSDRRSGDIVIATSIPPKLSRINDGRPFGEDYQDLCIRSWRQCGFRILSVNHPGEIEVLSPRYPEVSFVPVHRDAREMSGRQTPYIADLLSALADRAEAVAGIANSDILFEPS